MTSAIPSALAADEIHDKAVELAKMLNGMRVGDALEILGHAKIYVKQASRTETESIPPRPPCASEAETSVMTQRAGVAKTPDSQ